MGVRVLVVLQIAIRTSNEPLERLTFSQDLESRRRITHPEDILQISKNNLNGTKSAGVCGKSGRRAVFSDYFRTARTENSGVMGPSPFPVFELIFENPAFKTVAVWLCTATL